MSLDLAAIRSRFPALDRKEGGVQVAHLDGPAGTQVPIDVIRATDRVYRTGVANTGGGFSASTDAEAVVAGARSAVADLLGVAADEIVFGQNMTSLTFAVSRALSRTWKPGANVVVTTLDHDANRAPWRIAAQEAGVKVREAEFNPATGILQPEAVVDLIDGRTSLVAVTAASNALGSVTDLGSIIDAAHSVGALVYVDAVHFSAHRLFAAASLGADFVVASSYKFFGPHTGMMFGRRHLLAEIAPYKLLPASDQVPDRWETGTQSFESLAGVSAAIDYLASLGSGSDRRSNLKSAFGAIREHEDSLATRFLAGLASLAGVTLHGPGLGGGDRVATFAITVSGQDPQATAAHLARRGIFTWHGDYYATSVMERLGLAASGGAVRIGFVHYNSSAEVDRVLEGLESAG